MIMLSTLNYLRSSRLGKILLQFSREFWLATAISAVVNLLLLTPTIYMLQIFDRVMISQSVFTLVAISAVVLFFYTVQALGEWLRSRLIISAGVRMDHVLNEPIFRAVFRDQLRSFGKSPVQAFSDLNVIRQWLTGAGLFAFLDLPWTPIYVAVMFALHPWLGVLTIVFMLLLAGFAWLSSWVTGDATDESEEEERELNRFIYAKLKNAEVIEAHGMVPNLRSRWWKRQVEMISLQVRAGDLQERMTATSKQLRFLMNSLALGAGALLCIKGEITLGAMIAASLLMSKATSPIDMMVSGWKGLIAVKKSFLRIEKLLSETSEKDGFIIPEAAFGHVELRGVSAMADQRSGLILKNITATFPAGKIYVILGRSGAGKSTLGKVILGIWPKSEGQILLDGVPIGHFDRDALGGHLGYLPQDIELFQGSVAANIARMGEIDSGKVIEAAKRTNTHHFILSLAQGYDTEIGDRGSSLSGGQRQRIALARAIYGTPKLLVLDEPNANLDQQGDLALRDAILSIKEQGSSVFLITHRPNILDIADSVILMESGEITFFSSRAEFMERLRAQQTPSAGLGSSDLEPPADAEPIPV